MKETLATILAYATTGGGMLIFIFANIIKNNVGLEAKFGVYGLLAIVSIAVLISVFMMFAGYMMVIKIDDDYNRRNL